MGRARLLMLLPPLLLSVTLVGCSPSGAGERNQTAPATLMPTTTTVSRPAIAPATRPSPSPSSSASPSPAARPLSYVAIGASDTVGVGATDPARDGWVPRLAQLLGPTTRVRNLGVSGTLIASALREQLPAAVREQPDLVTVWLAVNDLNARVPLKAYAADLDTLLGALERQTHAVLLLANVPDLTLVPAYRDLPAEPLRAEALRWNAAIADAARRHHAHLVDLFAEYAELAARPELLSADGFHPSSAGYARVAEVFYAVARAALR